MIAGTRQELQAVALQRGPFICDNMMDSAHVRSFTPIRGASLEKERKP